MRIAMLAVVLICVALLVWMAAYTVDPTEFVYVTQFGKHVVTFDGGDNDSDAGLHFHWPWPIQSVRRLDRRLQMFDLPTIELLTRDSSDSNDQGGGVDKTLTVEAYVCWRIAEKTAVDRFMRKVDNAERARLLVGQRVNSQLGAFIGQMRMVDLISTDVLSGQGNHDGTATRSKVDQTIHQLREKLLGSLQEDVLKEYGLQIVDIELRRFNHPIKVRDTIFQRIRSEREMSAAKYRSEGKKQADDIRTLAQVNIDLLTKAAEKIEKETKAEAERDAEKIRVAAYEQDRDFFRFWQDLEQMKSILGSGKMTLLLSTHRPVFDRLFEPPGATNSKKDSGTTTPAPAVRKEARP